MTFEGGDACGVCSASFVQRVGSLQDALRGRSAVELAYVAWYYRHVVLCELPWISCGGVVCKIPSFVLVTQYLLEMENGEEERAD